MKVCDICKKPSSYDTTAHINPDGGVREVDLCGSCYKLFYEKQNKHLFLAYQETISEVTGKSEDNSWLKRYLGFWR